MKNGLIKPRAHKGDFYNWRTTRSSLIDLPVSSRPIIDGLHNQTKSLGKSKNQNLIKSQGSPPPKKKKKKP